MKDERIKILHLEDDLSTVELTRSILNKYFPDLILKHLVNKTDYLKAIESERFEVVLLSYNLRHLKGSDLLALALKHNPDTAVIFVSDPIDLELAIACIHSGATDFVLKEDIQRLPLVIESALHKRLDGISRRNVGEEWANERSQVEKSERKFYEIFQSSQDAICISTLPDGIYTDVNDNFLKIFGYTRDEVVGKSSLDIKIWKHEADRNRVMTSYGHQRSAFDQRIELLTKSGETVVTNINFRLVEIAGVDFSTAVISDITEKERAKEALKASELRLREAQKVAQIGSFEGEIHRNELWWSDELYILFGFKPLEFTVTMEMLTELLHPDDKEDFLVALKSCLETGEPFKKEFRGKHTSGEWCHFETVAEVTYDDGKILGISGTVQDITDRKLVESDLIKSEERLRLSTEKAGVSVWEYDILKNLMTRSSNHDSLYGLPPQGICGIEVFLKTIHPDDSESSYKILSDAMQANSPDKYELDFRVVWPDKSIHWLVNTGEVVKRDQNGVATMARGCLIDISDRKNMENSLRESEGRLRTLIENSPVCIHEINMKGKIISMNQSGLDMLGLGKEEEIYGLNYLDAVSEHDRPTIEAHLSNALKGEKSRFEFQGATEGDPVYYSSSFVPIINDAGDVQRLMGMSEDITERKIAFDQLQKNEARLQEAQRLTQQLLDASSTISGSAYFDDLTKLLCASLEAKFAFVGEYLPNEHVVTTISYAIDGVKQEQFEYELANTPCEDVMGNKVCTYPDNVQQLYPKDADLKALAVKSYIGAPLFDENNDPIGLIVVMNDKPMQDVEGTERLINIVIKRTSTELARKRAEIALRQSADRFERWKSSNFIGIIQTNGKGQVTDANDALLDMLGYSRQELLAGKMTRVRLTPKEYLHLDDKATEEAAEKGFWTPFEKEYFHKDGHRIPILVGGSVFKESRDDYIVFVIDLSKQKEAEWAVKVSEEKFRSFSECAPNLIIEIDKGGKILYLNKSGEDFLGTIDQNLYKYIQSEDQEDVQSLVDRVFKNGMSGVFDTQWTVSDNRASWYSSNIGPILDEDGKVSTAIIVAQDTTERQLTNQKLLQVQSQMQQQINAMNVSAIVSETDPNGNITIVNDKFCEISGYVREELIGRNHRMLKSGKQPQGIFVGMWKAISMGKIWTGEIMNKKKGGDEYYWVDVTIVPFKDALGNIEKFVAIRFDITDVKNQQVELKQQSKKLKSQREDLIISEKALTKTNKELKMTLQNVEKIVEVRTAEISSVLKNLKATQKQLVQKEKLASIGQLTAGVAHELNNPINFVNAGVVALSYDLDDVFNILEQYEKQETENGNSGNQNKIKTLKENLDYDNLKVNLKQTLDDMKMGALRTADIVKGLQHFTRMDTEEKVMSNIHDGLDDSLTLLGNALKNKVEVIKHYGADVEEIACYPGQLSQVFLNILANAEQAIQVEGTITISTKSENNKIVVSIKDNGIGMSKEVQHHVFDPFYTTKEVGSGVGLGMSISYGIVERHNGNIEIKSEEGKGTEFLMTLPKITNDK